MVGIPPWESCERHFVKLGILSVPCLYLLALLQDLKKRLLTIESNNDKSKRESTHKGL